MGRLSYIPASIVGGETIWISALNTTQGAVDIILSDYTPADSWTLAYSFDAATPFTVTAVANGALTGWTLSVTGVQTLTMAPRNVSYIALVTKEISGADRTIVVDSGVIAVSASPLRVSSWVAVLAAVDAAILAFAASPNGSITVDGMSVSYRGMDDLIKLRDYANYKMQQDSASRPKRIIRSRFNV